VAAPPAQPSFDAGPPRGPTPPPSGPGQRRFNFLIVGLTILLAVLLVGGLVLYNRQRSKPPAADRAKAEVERAYLQYDAASDRAVKTLDVSFLAPLVSQARLQKEQALIQQVVQSGNKFQVTSDHDMQTVVYSGGSLASIDE